MIHREESPDVNFVMSGLSICSDGRNVYDHFYAAITFLDPTFYVDAEAVQFLHCVQYGIYDDPIVSNDRTDLLTAGECTAALLDPCFQLFYIQMLFTAFMD